MKQTIKDKIKKHNENYNVDRVAKTIYEAKNDFFLGENAFTCGYYADDFERIEELSEKIDEITAEIELIPCEKIHDFGGESGEVFLAENGYLIYLERGCVEYAADIIELIENVIGSSDYDGYEDLIQCYDKAMEKLAKKIKGDTK